MRSLATRINATIIAGILLIMGVVVLHFYQVYAAARKENQEYIQSICDSTQTSLENKFGSIRKAAATLAHNTYVSRYYATNNLVARLELKPIIDLYASYILSNSADVLAVSFFDESNHMFSYGIAMDSVVISSLQRAYPEIVHFQPMQPFFTGIISSSNRPDYYAYIMPVYSTISTIPMTRVATCVVLCNARTLSEVIDQPMPQSIVDIQIVDASGKEVAARGKPADAAGQHIESIVRKMAATDWHLDVSVDNAAIGQVSPISSVMMVIFLCCLLLAAIWIILLTGLVYPIRKLTDQLAGITRSGAQLVSLRFHNELDIITEVINAMLSRLSESERQRFKNEAGMYALQIHLKQAELSALQSQINPHFLYNTLECLRSIGLYNRVPEVITISTAMAAMFRYSIKGAPWVTVDDELAIVNEYLSIVRIRFDDRFAVAFDIQGDARKAIIPKMILQPLVENAVYHGLEGREQNGRLTVAASVEDGKLRLQVSDNGKGMSEEILENLRRQLKQDRDIAGIGQDVRSVGLVNINQRIRLLSGLASNMDVSTMLGKGTSVTLYLPVTLKPPSHPPDAVVQDAYA